jgi:hypothetical protein
MVKISVEMARGGSMMLEATGRCVRSTDGAGAPYNSIDDLQLFWPRHPRDKKSYPVKDSLVKKWSQVEESFWDACEHSRDE